MTGTEDTSKTSRAEVNELMKKAFAVAALCPMYRNMKGSINQRVVPVLDIAFCIAKNQYIFDIICY